MLSRLFIVALWSPTGKGPTSWLLLVTLLHICYFPMWHPGSGVVLDCIVSRSLPSFLLCLVLIHILIQILKVPSLSKECRN